MDVIKTCLVYILIAFHFHFKLSGCQTSDNVSRNPKWQQCVRKNSQIVCNYLPKEIPEGTKTVTLRNLNSIDFLDRTLRKGSFKTRNWGQVTKLELSADDEWLETYATVEVFDSSCFFELQDLEILRISISTNIEFTSQTFTGLTNLKLLDLSGCRRLYLDNLVNSLNQSGIVPNLQSLNLSRLNSYREGLHLNDWFFKLISDKPVKELDVSSTEIGFMNVTSFVKNCHSLEYLNISRVKFNSIQYEFCDQLCPNLKYVDTSYIILPSNVLPDRGTKRVISDRNLMFDPNWTFLRNFRNVEYINLSAVTRKDTSYSFENVTIYFIGANKLNLKTLITRDNYYERLDLKLIFTNVTIEKLDLSGCKIRYLHPGVLSSLQSLTWIDLSRNHLNDMMTENATLFGEMFRNLNQLNYISLAGNELTDLPRDTFRFNIRAEIIDLSDNLLMKLSFETNYFNNLRLLDLTNNMIKVIDSVTLNTLDEFQILLKGNPLSCSRCDSLDFIRWILTSKSTRKSVSDLKCHNENSEMVYVDKDVIDNLQGICNRQRVIIISCVAFILVIVVGLVALPVIRRYRRRRQYELEMKDRVALIRKGAESCNFVVFLSYSSLDDDFVSRYVYPLLNEHLQNMIEEDRDLVCEGDRNFQLGRPIPDQISLLLKRSSVVVVLLSDNYSLSVHCRNEFDQAFMLEKPIVLMIKDQVNTELMTPLIRDLYEKRTRILWRRENGQYVLKTSWENVCTSIIELVDIKTRENT